MEVLWTEGSNLQYPLHDQLGLVPRFIMDLFTLLNKMKTQEAITAESMATTLLDYCVSVSFVEVYGDKIQDLLLEDDPCNKDSDASLPPRKDGVGYNQIGRAHV